MAVLRPRRRLGSAARNFKPLLIALALLLAGFFLTGTSKVRRSEQYRAVSGAAGSGSGSKGSSREGSSSEGSSSSSSSTGGSDEATAQARSGGGGGGSSSGGGSSGALPAARSVCEDACPGFNGNGVCDEGRAAPGAQPDSLTVFEVNCDLGTDCKDCGPWEHANTPLSDSWRPIAEIKEKKFEVYARQTAHPSGYVMAFTNGEKDVDVSSHLHSSRLFEPVYTWAWHLILKDGCRGTAGEQRLVADIGANFGYYSLLAASMGCRVVAWEPVPYFAAYFKYALLRNNLTHAVELRENIVGSTSNTELTIVVPNRGIWGTAGIDGANIDGAIKNEGDYDKITRRVERVDEVVKEDVLVMKIDVEGFEPAVLQGSKNLFLQHTVHNLFMEYSPGVAERAHDWKWFEQNPTILMGLLRAGYTILHIGEVHDQPDWSGAKQLPKMEQVTEEALKHDILDAWRLQDRKLGCIPDAASLLEGLGQSAFMFGCGALPEGVDPHSFRATFGHNTNIWAYKGSKPAYAQVEGVATLAPLDYDIQKGYFIPGGAVGAAKRVCAHLDAPSQVMHRCPCLQPEVCGALEERVKKLAAEGKLPPFKYEGRFVQPDKLGIETWR